MIEYDSDEIEAEDEDDLLDDNEKYLIDMALQLSQQSEVNMTKSTIIKKSQ